MKKEPSSQLKYNKCRRDAKEMDYSLYVFLVLGL